MRISWRRWPETPLLGSSPRDLVVANPRSVRVPLWFGMCPHFPEVLVKADKAIPDLSEGPMPRREEVEYVGPVIASKEGVTWFEADGVSSKSPP